MLSTTSILFNSGSDLHSSVKHHARLIQAFEDLEDTVAINKTRTLAERRQRMMYKNVSVKGRCLGCAIYDMPHIWSGLATIESIKRKLQDRSWKPTKEHYFARQQSGEIIVEYAIKCIEENLDFLFDDVVAMFNQFCKVHYVTSEENLLLKSWTDMTVPGGNRRHTGEEAYRLTGLEHQLIEARDLFSYKPRGDFPLHLKQKYYDIIDELEMDVLPKMTTDRKIVDVLEENIDYLDDYQIQSLYFGVLDQYECSSDISGYSTD